MIDNNQHDTMNVTRYPSPNVGRTRSLVGARYFRKLFISHDEKSTSNLIMMLNMSITITVNTVQCSFPAVGISVCFHNNLLFQNGRGDWISSSSISINRQ